MARKLGQADAASSTVTPAISALLQDRYRTFEMQRRLRLAGRLLPIFAFVQALIFVLGLIVLVDSHFPTPLFQVGFVTVVLFYFGFATCVAGIVFARHGRVEPATWCLIIPSVLTTLIPVPLYDIVCYFYLHAGNLLASSGALAAVTLNVLLAAYGLLILVALLATNRWQLIATTLLLNVYTLGTLLFAMHLPGIGAELGREAQLFIPLPLLAEWSAAGILITSMDTSLRTMRELGEVQVAYERAQRLDDLKDQFITHINHELRSPVMAMQGHIELLLLANDTLAPDEQVAYLQRAKHAGDNLVALVASILDIQAMEHENATLTFSPVVLKPAVEAATQLIDPREVRLEGRELWMHVPDDLAVWAEPVRVRQILTNLLSNAFKYSPAGSRVEVAAEITVEAPPLATRRGVPPSQSQVVEITVRDYGLGIPPDQIPLLFERFVRLPRDLASNVIGNGLGLHLCLLLTRQMQGRIWVESTGVEGEGSIFHLQLPLPHEEHEEHEEHEDRA